MNLFAFAMQMEVDGKAYYEKLARETSHPGLRTIFNRLAEDEQKHYETLRALKEQASPTAMQETTVLADARNVFAELPRDASTLTGMDDLSAYDHAMHLEEKSFELYEDAASRESDEATRALLLKIAGEEHKHFNVLANLSQFVNAPNQYLAWREFSNLEEFHQFGRDVDA